MIIDQSQRSAARVVGGAYLLVTIAAYFSEFFVRATLIEWNDAAATVQNILGSQQLFRIGIASDLLGFAADIVLAAAFYVLLRPVSKGLALLGSFFRVTHATILCVATLNSLVALRFLSGADYLGAFDEAELHALSRFFLGVHGASYNVGLVFFGFGSTITSYLLYRSRYIPRALAAWGLFGSILVLACTVGFIVFPELQRIASPICFLPIGTFEIVAGLWLLIRGLKLSAAK